MNLRCKLTNLKYKNVDLTIIEPCIAISHDELSYGSLPKKNVAQYCKIFM